MLTKRQARKRLRPAQPTVVAPQPPVRHRCRIRDRCGTHRNWVTVKRPAQFNLCPILPVHGPSTSSSRTLNAPVKSGGGAERPWASTGAPQQEEAGKVLALEVLLEGVDKDGVFLAEDGQGAVVFYDINDHRWSWSNARRKAQLVVRHAGSRASGAC